LFARFEAASGTIKGVECWSARELQTVLGYAEWRSFTTVVDKAREACEAAGEVVTDHFVGINKMVGSSCSSHRKSGTPDAGHCDAGCSRVTLLKPLIP
jgi:DNA-damage-inducible protein D